MAGLFSLPQNSLAKLLGFVLASLALAGLTGCGGGGLASEGTAAEGPRAGSGSGAVAFTLDFRSIPGRTEPILTSVDLSRTSRILVDIMDPQTRALHHAPTLVQRQPGVDRQTVIIRDVLPGTHLLRLRLQDSDGVDLMVDEEVATVSVGQSTSVVFDMKGADQPPTVAFNSPTQGQTVSGNISLQAQAQDDKGVAQVEFFLDGAPLGTDPTPPYQQDWNTATAADGPHTLQAVARDTTGQTARDSITVNVSNFVDNPPTVNLTAPSDGQAVFGTINIQANASDDVNVTQVEFFMDATSLGTDATAPYSMNWDSTGVANGLHALKAVARDTAGQTSFHTINVNVSNVVDNPPTVSFTFPTDGLGLGGTVTFQATANDDFGINQVEFFVDGVSVGVDSVAPYERVWNSTTVADGSRQLKAVATDTTSQTGQHLITINVSNPSFDVVHLSPTLAGADGRAEASPGRTTSANGAITSFHSPLNNLVAGDTGFVDVFVRDVAAGVTERVSVTNAGGQPNHDSVRGGLSPNGRFVVFASRASNLVAGDTNGRPDIFVRDRQLGTTTIISVASDESLSNGDATLGGVTESAGVTDDGRFVVFENTASNLAGTDTNGVRDVFMRDTQAPGTTELISVKAGGGNQAGNGVSFWASMSNDARYVAFESSASDLVAGDTNGVIDCFVRDRQTGTTVRISVSSGGVEGDKRSVRPFISANGRFVAFLSDATNLVPGDTNGGFDVFVRDLVNGTTSRVSVATGGGQSAGGGLWNPPEAPANYLLCCSISGDGRYVSFDSTASDLVAGDTNRVPPRSGIDSFVHDRLTQQTIRVSLGPTGNEANHDAGVPCISDDGRYVVFTSLASNLTVPAQPGFLFDVFRSRNVLAP
ncbi:MAG: hypothetical protein HY319_31170 [Armatimonadetes bacterium]|nr:hypothetical protein [Armatimonadota bacterium]